MDAVYTHHLKSCGFSISGNYDAIPWFKVIHFLILTPSMHYTSSEHTHMLQNDKYSAFGKSLCTQATVRRIGSVSKLLLQCAVVSLYSVVKQWLKCKSGKACNCLTLILLILYIYIYMLLLQPEMLTSYIYGPTFGSAESRLLLFAAQCFNTESMKKVILLRNCV
jgi:hypothetical protein